MGHKNMLLRKQFKSRPVADPIHAGSQKSALEQIKKLTAQEVAEIGSIVLGSDMSSLRDLVESEEATVLTKMIAAIAYKAIRTGNIHALDMLLDRIIGKAGDQLEATDTNSGPRVILYLPDSGRSAPPPNEDEPNSSGVTLTLPFNGTEAPDSYKIKSS